MRMHKPAAALNILREVILGRELFDFAFREYSQRWKYKRPTPSDFFRTMEEASGVDLDWFWHGWFYTTDHVDISVDAVSQLRLDTKNPDIDFARLRDIENEKPEPLFVQRNREAGMKTWVETNPDVRDFYDEHDIFTVTNKERNAYKKFIDGLQPWQKRVFERAVKEDKNYYVIDFSNKGGLVMPILLDLHYVDGTKESKYLPAEIWRRSPKAVKHLHITDKELVRVEIDANWETADTNIENNIYPRRIIPSRVEAFKTKAKSGKVYRDIMQDCKTKLKEDEKEGKAEGSKTFQNLLNGCVIIEKEESDKGA